MTEQRDGCALCMENPPQLNDISKFYRGMLSPALLPLLPLAPISAEGRGTRQGGHIRVGRHAARGRSIHPCAADPLRALRVSARSDLRGGPAGCRLALAVVGGAGLLVLQLLQLQASVLRLSQQRTAVCAYCRLGQRYDDVPTERYPNMVHFSAAY